MWTIRKAVITSGLLLFLSVTCMAQVCQRHREPEGGFSLCVPPGWTIEAKDGQRFKLFFGPRGEHFTPTINFKDEANTTPLADYVAASIKTILESYPKIGAASVKVVGQNTFVTSSGIPGTRVAFITEFKSLVIRTLQYYFNTASGQKLIITGTALEGDKEKLDPVFEEAVKTFQFDR